MNREEALAFITKVLPVWPDDLSTAALLGKQCQTTGWYFSSDHNGDLVYKQQRVENRRGLPLPISKADWLKHTAEVYGPGNDGEVEGDGDFAAINRGALQEKGDGEEHPDQLLITAVEEVCSASHTFARAGENHPMDEDGEWMCPHCMARALSRIYGALDDYANGVGDPS